MNLNEYKEKRLSEVDYLFRGIYFENIKKHYEIIIENIVYENQLINLDFINRNNIYREVVEKVLLDIRALRSELEGTYLANLKADDEKGQKKEIDKEIEIFIGKVMNVLNRLRDEVLKDFYKKNKIENNLSSYINSSLNIFEISLGDTKYSWNDDENAKLGENTKPRNYEVIDDIRLVIAYIYALPNMRKDKVRMQQNLHNERENFKVGTPEYNQLLNYYITIYNSKNYENIQETYDSAVKFIDDNKKTR